MRIWHAEILNKCTRARIDEYEDTCRKAGRRNILEVKRQDERTVNGSKPSSTAS